MSRRIRAVLLGLIVVGGSLGWPPLHAQFAPPPPMPTGTGLIVGQVVDAATNNGVAGVVVTLGGGGADQPGQVVFGAGAAPVGPQRIQAMTASDGRFAFRNLAKGNYTITAAKGGYLAGGYGRRRPNGPTQSIELADGARLGPFTVPIWKHGVLTGTISDESGEPVVGITVQAMRRSISAGKRRYQNAGQATTDDRGVYRIARLVPGDYIVAIVSTSTSVPVSTMDEYNRLTMNNDPAGTALMRKLMETSFNILGRGGIGGQVRQGDTIQTVGDGPTPPPTAEGAKMFGYPTTFYPGTSSSAQATAIALASGEERTGIDIQVKPVPMSRISGTVVGPNGPAETVGVHLMPAETESPTDIEVAATATDRAGNFTMLGVAPGNYLLKVSQIPRPASAPTTATIIQMNTGGGGMTMFGSSTSDGTAAAPPPVPTDPTLWAAIPMPVGRTDVSGVAIALRTGVRVSGHVEFEGSKDKPSGDALTRISILMDSADGEFRSPGPAVTPGRVQASGQFNTPGFPGGRYLLRVGGVAGWSLKSAMYQGRDISDMPIDLDSADIAGVVITFTDQPNEISGTVQGAGGGDPDASVIAFPTDAAAWTGNGLTPRRLRLSRAGPTGSYKLTGLPAGTYYLVAVPDEFTSDWQDAKFLASLAAGATQVTLDDGQKKIQDVRLVRPR
jgi:hypothetical protein